MISVIIPVYNRRTTITRAINSVLKQTYRDFELLVVDDGSDDGTPEAVRDTYGDALRLLVQDENRGVSAARNLGVREARGEWVAFLDSDDEWLPQKLECQMKALKSSGLKLCHTDEIWVRDGVRVNPCKHHRKYGGDIFLKVLPLSFVSPSSILLHREVIERVGLFDEAFPVCEDYDLFLRISNRYEICFLPEKLIIKYGGHADQLSRSQPAMDRFRVRALDKLLKTPPGLNGKKEAVARAMLIEKARIVLQGARKRGNCQWMQEMETYIRLWEGKSLKSTALNH